MSDASGPEEWSASYSRHVTRTLQRSARIFDLYYLVLEGVARRELSLEELRAVGTRSLEVYGPAYVARMGELNAQFFAGLLAASIGADDAPPAYDPKDPAGWFHRLMVYAAQGHGARARALSTAAEHAASERFASADVVGAVGSDAITRPMATLGPLVFDLIAGLAEAGAAYQEEYLRAMLTSRQSGRGGMELHAAIGEVASASLTLENTRSESTTVRCLVTDVRRADGIGPAFVPAVTFDPDALVLGPHEERCVGLTLALGAEAYAPNAPYVGAVRVLRRNEGPVDVPLTIVASQPGRPPLERGR